MPSTAFRFGLLLCLSLNRLCTSQAEAQTPSQLVFVEPGDLPIILTAPHGGSEAIPGVSPRQGAGVALFRPQADAFTAQLTEKLADAIEANVGKRPYVVIAQFHRKYLDANRRARDAFESPQAETVYAAYHQAITDARDDIVRRWGRGTLIDIHGQATEPRGIFSGTQNGKTTTHLTNQFGREALIGESSLFGLLSKHGLQVIPAINSSDNEHPNYNGGYTVGTYGSSSGGTFDAIQLELGRELRVPGSNTETANKLADAITEFSAKYLAAVSAVRMNGGGKTTRFGNSEVRIGVYVDEGAGSSANKLLAVLANFEGVSVTQLTADDIRSGQLADLDLLMQPGGSGGGQGRHLGEAGREAIRDFVSDGGGFIGICAGAYLASADYSWSLNILDAKVIDRQHWNRGNGEVEIALSDSGRQVLRLEGQTLSIQYAQGPLLAPANRPEIEDYDVIATFETEIAKNGAPTGVMKGTTAIAKGQFGNGRVICFSPHPELTTGLEHTLLCAIEYVKRSRLPDAN